METQPGDKPVTTAKPVITTAKPAETTTEPQVTVPNPGSVLYGDVNNDGKVDVTDISTLALILADRKDMTPDQIVRADVTNNGKVELADLARIRQFISRVINSLDPNK